MWRRIKFTTAEAKSSDTCFQSNYGTKLFNVQVLISNVPSTGVLKCLTVESPSKLIICGPDTVETESHVSEVYAQLLTPQLSPPTP